ncbi:hypothetical protein L9F63_022925, partial [Diploptera punctata]
CCPVVAQVVHTQSESMSQKRHGCIVKHVAFSYTLFCKTKILHIGYIACTS